MADVEKSIEPVSYAEHIDAPEQQMSGSGTGSEGPATPYAEHGAGIDHKIDQEFVVKQRPDLWWSRQRAAFREPLSEFFGVFILILFGDGVVAQVVLSGGTKGSYQSISWGWG
jgi:aquaglyceroporin related protein